MALVALKSTQCLGCKENRVTEEIFQIASSGEREKDEWKESYAGRTGAIELSYNARRNLRLRSRTSMDGTLEVDMAGKDPYVAGAGLIESSCRPKKWQRCLINGGGLDHQNDLHKVLLPP